jgi:alpha,alpha-trehalase
MSIMVRVSFRLPSRRTCFRLALCLLVLASPVSVLSQSAEQPGLAPIRNYIANGWDVLTRSMSSCNSVADPKLAAKPVLYLPANFAEPATVQKMETDCKVRVEHLPQVVAHPGELDPGRLNPPGLLYLPNPYVVPGGRFNEMYGWDSYFIVVGLLRDGRVDLAKGMVDNFLFEIENYGTILNANRTYFLTRSQPPFLTTMITGVYEAEKAAGRADRAWLEHAYTLAAKDYENWIHEPHLAGSTGLSRYYDYGEGPVPEGLQDEAGHYRNVTTYFLSHPESADHYIVDSTASDPKVGFTFTLQLCEETTVGTKCEPYRSLSLSRDFYKGDRAMRESGFDISFRFAPYGAATHHFAPVCLNSLHYKTEKDLEQISGLLSRKSDSAKWRERAEMRKQFVNKYLWDAKRGMFFDYNVDTHSQSDYTYITAFYPLWAGLATPEQANALTGNIKLLEHPGGLAMSNFESGAQWDLPYGWAPTQLLAIKGLRRYGKNADADRISYNFLSTIAENFRRDGTIREKYNVISRSTESHVTTGYQMNVVGFGWTNGAFEELLYDLPKESVERLAKEQSSAASAK